MSEIIGYVDGEYGECLCERHGEARNEAIKENCASEGCDAEDCMISPIFSWDGDAFACVEYCAAGHSFCGSCGHDLEGNGEDIKGNLAVCHNCSTASVYVDGKGYVYVDRLDCMSDHVTVKVLRHDLGLITNHTARETSIDAVRVNVTGWNLRTLRASVAFLPHMPDMGAVLLLTDTMDEAWAEAEEFFTDLGEEQGEDEEGMQFIREDVTLRTGIDLREELEFHTK